jgi:uncharacterized protein YprB with RNaseH-like and TPR domain
MGLEERLRLLRGAAPPSPETPDGEPGPSLAERLARLRSVAGTLPVRDPRPGPLIRGGLAEQMLADALEGTWVAPGVLLVERRIPLTQTHGAVSLGAGLAALAGLARRVLGQQVGSPSSWRLLDTETSGLAGGTGTWVFACGVGRPEGEALVLRQYLLTRLDAEPAFLAALTQALAGCDLLVSYNGKSFDLPLLATRLRLDARDGGHVGNARPELLLHSGHVPHPWGPGAIADEAGLRLGLDSMPHLDLLHPVRRSFARVWPDCRLGTAEARLLGLRRHGDLAGSEAPRAWLDWLRRGETAGLAGVLGHNRLDLLSLAVLPAPLALTLADPARTGADPLAVAGWQRDHGDQAQARAILEANRLSLTPAGLMELARYRLRSRDWTGARDLWEPLAEAGDPDAMAALARLWEHRLGDPAQALTLARRLPPSREQERRCRRLEERLARSNAQGLAAEIERVGGRCA